MRNCIIIALSLIFLNLKSQFSIDSLSFNPSLEDSIILDAITPPGEVIEHIDSFYHRTEALQKKNKSNKMS
jgi:hypothetical protein